MVVVLVALRQVDININDIHDDKNDLTSIHHLSEETDLHRLLRSSRPDRLDEHWLNKCRHVFTSTLRSSNDDSFPYSRII